MMAALKPIVDITGPKGPRGLPGVNAVENDTAVSEYIQAEDSDTRAALDRIFARRRIHILSIDGQSNAGGRGVEDGREPSTNPQIFEWSRNGASAGTLIPAVDPLHHPDGRTGVGFGLTMARLYAATLPPDDLVVLVPNAQGGTTILDQTATGWAAGVNGNHLDRAQTAVLNAKQTCEDTYPDAEVVIDGVFFFLGETDAGNGASRTAFRSAVEAMIQQGRNRFGGNTPYIFFELMPEQRNLKPAAANINGAYRDICRSNHHIGLVTTRRDELGFRLADYLHVNADGHRKMYGPRAFEALIDAKNGRFANVNANEPAPTFPGRLMNLLNETFDGADGVMTAIGSYALNVFRVGGTGTPAFGRKSNALGLISGGGSGGIAYWAIDPVLSQVRARLTWARDGETSPRLILSGTSTSSLANALVLAPGSIDYLGYTILRAVKYNASGANPVEVWRSDYAASGSNVVVWTVTPKNTIRVFIDQVFAFEEPVEGRLLVGGGVTGAGSSTSFFDDLQLDVTNDTPYPDGAR